MMRVHVLRGDRRTPVPTLVRAGENYCAFVAEQKSTMGSAWSPTGDLSCRGYRKIRLEQQQTISKWDCAGFESGGRR
jgi:hypothetical protein